MVCKAPKVKAPTAEAESYLKELVRQIADNSMFPIINSFIGGEITDEQCKHCLAAVNQGNNLNLYEVIDRKTYTESEKCRKRPK